MSAVEFFRKMRGVRLLVVGDVMLDVYQRVGIKPSIEASRHVYDVRSEAFFPGGAANAACIARQLGADIYLAGVVGDDDAGNILRKMFFAHILLGGLVVVPGRPTTTKTRVLYGRRQLARYDRESTQALNHQTVIELTNCYRPGFDAVLFSDYGKGVLDSDVITAMMKMAPLRVLDPKRSWEPFAGVQYATPNLIEADGSEGLERALRALPEAAIVTTHGPRGASITNQVSRTVCQSRWVSTATVQDANTVGAGDAFAAGFTLAKAAGADDWDAVVIGHGVARWWVLHDRVDVLSLTEVEEQITIVEAAQ